MTSGYKFRSNSDLYLTGDLQQMLPGVIAYGIQFDLNLYTSGTAIQAGQEEKGALPLILNPSIVMGCWCACLIICGDLMRHAFH